MARGEAGLVMRRGCGHDVTIPGLVRTGPVAVTIFEGEAGSVARRGFMVPSERRAGARTVRHLLGMHRVRIGISLCFSCQQINHERGVRESGRSAVLRDRVRPMKPVNWLHGTGTRDGIRTSSWLEAF